jgi:hypothetical protein
VIAVAEATMRRVARNADLLADRLDTRGWKPLPLGRAELRTKPSATDAAIFQQIEEISGAPVPPSLVAFWKVVGGINFVWDYESDGTPPDLGLALPMDEMDPLCVVPPAGVERLFDEWKDPEYQRLFFPAREAFRIDLAPDYLHKANISGGSPYAIIVPFNGADQIFAYEKHALPFVDYLRLAFSRAGFPGLEDHAERDDVRRFVTEFGRGLEPF